MLVFVMGASGFVENPARPHRVPGKGAQTRGGRIEALGFVIRSSLGCSPVASVVRTAGIYDGPTTPASRGLWISVAQELEDLVFQATHAVE